MQDLTRISTDVLVVGGGLAGCWAAIRARQRGASVCLLDKGPVGKTGASKFASGDIKTYLPQDNLLEWIHEIVVGGDYLADQRWVEVALLESLPRVDEMDGFGVKFERTPDGQYRRESGRGRITLQVVFNGAQLMEAMRRHVQHLGARIQDRIFTDQVLVSDGRPCGVLGFDTRDGRAYVVEAKAVILANGACTLRANYFGQHFSTGEAFPMAYNCGARLRAMEAIAWNSSSSTYDTTGMSRFVAMGGRFRNRLGDAFMERYRPETKDRSQVSWVVRGMATEVSEGRGPIYFDLTALTDAHHELSRKLIPWGMLLYDRAGIDIRKQLIEWMPSFQGTQGSLAGIVADMDGHTDVPGLFAIGDASSWPSHGMASGFGGLNLTCCIVFGARAGEAAAHHASGTAQLRSDPAQIDDLRRAFFAPLSRQSGPSPDQVLFEVQKNVFPYKISLIKEAGRLENALAQLSSVERDMLPAMTAPDVHELVKAREVEACLFYAQAVLRSALHRQESRGMHLREDFPNRDDKNWLKWTYVQREGGQMEVWSEDLPAEAFKHVPIPTPSSAGNCS